ncbi:ABC transporter substrate-binding protein [Granulosicoccus antarcticus]|uniref:Heme-binding protein A n=1 Tax=Granulosicoccus antarcticus IMCC3135 TaxID=1192854 RepID=A0A2Z2NYB8_9GAMM|nr:ABC transporter substrate-binding protein [Granulosicoccus antarcticus]ASJ76436.1 Heme-binding protein A [Granulosicoccus antarcticus IMCC3135]
MNKRFSLPALLVLTCAVSNAFAARTDIILGVQLEPPNLDPTAGAAAAIDEVVYANIFEGLTRFGPDGSIKPALAAGWSIEDEGLRYIFGLRADATFHDGAEFSADDVKFSIDRAMADDSTNAQKGLFANIDNVEIIDPLTIAINLKQPDGNLLFNLAWGDAVILDPASAADAATHPVGTGPFKFANWVQGDRVEIVRYADYWGKPVKLEKATFKFISEPTAAYSAILAGDLDAFPNYPAPENLAQLDVDPRYSVVLGSTEGETILAMNNAVAPFDDVRVREAVVHAINRDEIIDGAMYGYGTPIGTHFAPHNPAYLDLTAQSAFDPEKSKALLKEAGHENDLTVTLKLPPPVYARRGGEIIAAQLRDVGITANIENLEWAQWLEQVFKGKDFDLTIISHTEPMDIGIYANPDYYFQYDNADLQALMTSLNTETDPDKRTELLQQAQQIIADDYVNAYLFQLARAGVANSRIKGLWENSPTQANDLTGVYWEE